MSIMSIFKEISSHRKIYIKEGKERENRGGSIFVISDIALYHA